MDLKRIIIATLLAASVTSTTSCNSDFFAKKSKKTQESAPAKQMVYAPELDPEVHELVTDQRFNSLENEEPLRFETAVTPDEAASDTPVELRDDSGKTLSKMYDDGTHSDRIAGDGIYTCSYQPKPDGETSFSYTAKIGDTETEPASVRYFDKITEQDVEDMKAIGQKVTDIESEYLDSEGYVPDDKKEEALNEIGEYAKSLYNNGEAVEYRVNNAYDNVIVKLSSGITMVYDTPEKENLGGSSNNSNDHPLTIKKYRIFTPDEGWYDHVGNALDGAGLDIANEFPNKTTDNTITERPYPYEVFSFGPDQVILWRGHGGYDPILHSYLATGHVFNEDDYDDEDIIEDRLLVEFKGDNKVRITSEYIDAHCPDMTNSFVYLGACRTGADSVLAASLINKNCNVVIGFDKSVNRLYCNNFLSSLISRMCESITTNRTSATKVYYSVSSASIYANTECLKNNPTWQADANSGNFAKPVIFGNRSYKFADAIRNDLEPPLSDAEEQARGTFTLENSYYSLKVGETIQIKTLTRPMGAGKLEWAIDDSKIATIDEDGNVTGVSSDVLDKDGNVISSSSAITTGHVVTEDGKYRQDFSITVTP